MNRLIATFKSTHDAIKAERLCLTHHLKCRTIAVPRSISSDCGIGLEIPEKQHTVITDILADNCISASWHQLP